MPSNEEIRTLSDQAVRKLQTYSRRVRDDQVNTPQRPAVAVHSVYMDTSQAPELYVALTPEDGLPSSETVGTVSTLETTLEGAECQVYYMVVDDGALAPIDGLTPRVYNLSSKEVGGGNWVLIARDKSGTWYAIAVLGSRRGNNYGEGECQLLKLNTDDCVVISYLNDETGEIDEYYLPYAGNNSWTSSDVFIYPCGGGSGVFELVYEAGEFHLYLGGLELLKCGDGCYSGSWITGHGIDESGTGAPESEPCNACAFTVCVKCGCCPIAGWDGPGWYCVNDLTSGTGTGTSDDECEVQYLMEEDICDDDIRICSGPYETEEEATAVCGGPIPAATNCNDITASLGTLPVPYSETYNIANGVTHWFWVPRAAGTISVNIVGTNITGSDCGISAPPAGCGGFCVGFTGGTPPCTSTNVGDGLLISVLASADTTYTITTAATGC